MKRPGRQKGSSLIGAELSELTPPDALSKRLYRRAALSGKTALIALYEAWHDAQLDGADHSRTGLIIGGSNMTQRELLQTFEKNGETPQFVNPTYGLSFMDSDLSGLCTEQFGIKGRPLRSAVRRQAARRRLSRLLKESKEACLTDVS